MIRLAQNYIQLELHNFFYFYSCQDILKSLKKTKEEETFSVPPQVI